MEPKKRIQTERHKNMAGIQKPLVSWVLWVLDPVRGVERIKKTLLLRTVFDQKEKKQHKQNKSNCFKFKKMKLTEKWYRYDQPVNRRL